MTVGQLKKKLEQFPDDFPVIRRCGTDYEEYCEISTTRPIYSFGSMCGLCVDGKSVKKPNSVIFW